MSRLLTSLPRIIEKAAGPLLFFDAVLTRYAHPTTSASPARDRWNPADPVPTTYGCSALFEDYEDSFRLGGSVKEGERKCLILARSLSVDPAPGDKIAITGYGEATAIRVSTDPARACWEIHSEWRRMGGA